MAEATTNPDATAGTKTDATPAPASAGVDTTALQAKIAALEAKLADAEKNLATIASTIEKAPPASAEEFKRIAREEAKAEAAEREAAAAVARAKAELRQKIVTDILGGDAELGELLPADADEAALKAAAEKLAAKVKKDFGAASGGKPATAEAVGRFSNLSPGTAKFASSLKVG